MMNKKFEQNFISNQNGTDKVNSISENSTKNKVVLIFTEFLTSHIVNKGALEHNYFRNNVGVRLLPLKQLH